MTKTHKLYELLVASPKSARFREFQRVLTSFGFTLDRVRGSHHIYRHRLVTRPLSVQSVGNMAKPYQIEQFLDIVEEFGLTIED